MNTEASQVQAVTRQLKSEQDLGRACVAGLLAAIVGALVWGAIGIATGYEVRFMSIGVGMLVGYAVRLAGKGVSGSYGVVGVAATVLGCLLGNLLSVAGIISGEQGLTVVGVLSQLDYELALELMMAFYQPLDSLFYGIALVQGYRLSFRQLSESEMALLLANQRHLD